MFNNFGQSSRPRVYQGAKQNDRYAFVCEYYDDQAEIMRNYQLLYYVTDETIEMFDLKSKRIFLKRMKYDLDLDDLYIGNTVTVYSRQLKVTAYGDQFTANKMATFTQTTVAIIRPDGFEDAGSIIGKIEHSGFRIKQLRMVQLDRERASEIYQDDNLVECMVSGPSIALELVGDNAIEKWKGMMADEPCLGSASTDDAAVETAFYFSSDQETTARFEKSSLLLIKPHAVTEGLIGKILGTLLSYSMDILALETFTLDTANAADFLEVYKGVLPEYPQMVSQYANGQCVAIEVGKTLDGNQESDIVEDLRDVAGPADPELGRILRPQSLRSLYGTNKIKNAIHVTDLEEDAPLETDFFFNVLRSSKN
mmetsp:Transcript_3279/g.4835  ORF Transcript_3279/g.4835 Transcript_3279/m.4835 type:complete len:367 (-) Transcript_3279:32-1132(-)